MFVPKGSVNFEHLASHYRHSYPYTSSLGAGVVISTMRDVLAIYIYANPYAYIQYIVTSTIPDICMCNLKFVWTQRHP
jgi:hypothetical protein